MIWAGRCKNHTVYRKGDKRKRKRMKKKKKIEKPRVYEDPSKRIKIYPLSLPRAAWEGRYANSPALSPTQRAPRGLRSHGTRGRTRRTHEENRRMKITSTSCVCAAPKRVFSAQELVPSPTNPVNLSTSNIDELDVRAEKAPLAVQAHWYSVASHGEP